jgi:hypothetical protein
MWVKFPWFYERKGAEMESRAALSYNIVLKLRCIALLISI